MVQLFQYLRNLADARVLSPNSDIRQGAQVSVIILLGLLTSHDRSSHHARRFALPMLSVFTLLLGTFLFSHSAYAASYLNVSSGAPGGTVTFSKVQPTSSGEMSTASDTLTVNTNCTVGYSVYVSAINGGDTNLTNDSASASGNNTIAPSSATVGGTATVLSADTWGINASSSDVSDGKYFGLPAYASATTTALTTRSNVDEETTVPIYYGAKVSTAIAPGTYSGDVLYTVLPNTACNYYTIAYNANGGSGEMNNQAVNVGETTALSENTFTRSGYTFLGWSNSANGKTGTATNGVGTMADVDYTNKQEVTDISDFNTTKNLYAIWAQLSGDMQTWTGCPALASDSTVYLRDARDDTVYAVKKLADGKCWMTENLILGHDKGYALTNEYTNIQSTDTATYYLPQAGYRGALNSSSTSGSATFDSSNDNQAQVQYRAQGSSGDQSSSGTLGQSTGYYNFYAATLGCSYYQDGLSSGQCASGYIQKDICPKGWQLPVGGNSTSTNQFSLLDIAMGGTGANRNDATARDRFLNQASFLYSGYYNSSQLYGVGSYGYWWSSTVSNTNYSYSLGLSSGGNVNPQDGSGKYYGFAVRCVAQNNYTVSYNANSGSGAASKASDTIYETGSFTTAGQGTLARDGYNFLGWSLDQNATSATYAANTAISVPDLITAAGSPASGSTITLYAVWEKAIEAMQGWTGCASLSVGQSIDLKDTRDNKVYAVKKLPDGKCWMMQNLTIGMDGAKTLTSADTNIDNGTTYYLPPAGKQGDITSSSTLTSTTAANFSTSNDNQAKTQFRTKDSSVTNDSDTGYYNFYTATLGFSYYNDGKTSGSSSNDICPKGWRMPKTTDAGTTVSAITSANDFTYLARQYSTSGWQGTATSAGYYISDASSVVHTGLHTGAAANGNNYAGFSYAGRWDGTNTSASLVGSNGYYWSSSVYSTNNGYYLFFSSSIVRPQVNYSKYFGYAVRCVTEPLTMQNTSASSLPENATTSLIDSRDGQSYTVYRWPSTGTAGTDYPTNMAGYAIMTKDLSLGYVTGGSVTKGANLTLTTSDSAAAATITARTGTGNWSTTNSDDNKQYINGTGGTYDSHSYYSYGAAKAVCPKGWRLPTNAVHGYIQSFMGGNNSTGSSKIRGTPYNYVYGGGFYSSGWGSVGSLGLYWSSTQYSSTNGYNLYFDSSNLYANYYNKNLGFSVRCVSS